MPLTRLVVFIPGIGGSILVDRTTDQQVWSHGKDVLAKTLSNPKRLDIGRPLRPVGLLQDVQLLPGWTVLQGYTDLWNQLTAIPGTVEDPIRSGRSVTGRVVAFPYDFRQSNRDSARELDRFVREELHRLGRPDEPNSVIVVAHSMGGLIARYWISRLGGHSLCHGLMTLGTPHRGAPKALDVLANGVPVNGGLLTRLAPDWRAVLARWGSMAELLPRYPCMQDPRHEGSGMYVHDLDDLGGQWADLAALGRRGSGFHHEIDTGWAELEKPPLLRTRVGVIQPTLQSARVTVRGIEVSELAPLWCDLGVHAMDGGDGTVPAISAFPLDAEGSDLYEEVVSRVPIGHGRIGNDPEATRFVEIREGFVRRTGARGEEHSVGLGLKAPDLSVTGAPIDVTVALTGPPLPRPESQVVYVDVEPVQGIAGIPSLAHPPVRAEWDQTVGGYRALLPGLPTGYWSVRGWSRAVPRMGDLSTTQDIAVVEDVG